jgi:hypothetical protein
LAIRGGSSSLNFTVMFVICSMIPPSCYSRSRMDRPSRISGGIFQRSPASFMATASRYAKPLMFPPFGSPEGPLYSISRPFPGLGVCLDTFYEKTPSVPPVFLKSGAFVGLLMFLPVLINGAIRGGAYPERMAVQTPPAVSRNCLKGAVLKATVPPWLSRAFPPC